MSEIADARLKRLKLRAWRRGTKEMDLILGGFADRQLAAMDDTSLTHFDALLDEDDQDLYDWVCGRASAPPVHAALVARIAGENGL